jgi:cytochrome c5
VDRPPHQLAERRVDEPVLLDHTIQGFNAMPAGGQCASCTPDDFKALIRFMAGREDSPN